MTKTRIALLCIVVALVAFSLGIARGKYTRGLQATAEIAQLEKRYADQEKGRALKVAETLKEALDKTKAETARAAKLESDLLVASAKIASQQKELSKRIADVAKNTVATCPYMPSVWVQFTNDATASASNCGTGGKPNTASLASGASASGAAVCGVPQGQPVTPEDYLAWIRDYGEFCRQLESQNSGWRKNDKESVK